MNEKIKENPYRDIDVERDELMIQELESKTTEDAIIEAKVEKDNLINLSANELRGRLDEVSSKDYYEKNILPYLDKINLI